MYADTRFGDFPHRIPTAAWTSSDELFAGWMLLSYRKTATASSTRDTFVVARVTDENPRTFWVAGKNQPGEWVTIDLGRDFAVKAIQVNYTDYRADRYGSDSTIYTQFTILESRDGRSWRTIADLGSEKRDRPNAYIELSRPVTTRYIRYVHGHTGGAELAISDIRVFGNGSGAAPAAPRRFAVQRDADQRNAQATWRTVPKAVGYNVLWGINPEQLHQTYQVFADKSPVLEIRALTVGQPYYFAIEAFDENGVSPRSAIVRIP